MKLTKKHIGRLFDVAGGDGSWVYQLVAVKKRQLLFYSFSRGEYYKESVAAHGDWRPFVPCKPWPKRWLDIGWQNAKAM